MKKGATRKSAAIADYERHVSFRAPAEQVFAAIATLDGLRGWWTTIVKGSAARDEFYLKLAGKSPAQMKAHWSKIIFTGRGQPPRQAGSNAEAKKAIADNPNAIGLRLDWLDFDLAINDTPILTSVRAEQGVHIPAHGVGDVHLRTRVGYGNLKALFRQIADMVQGNRAHYAIHGNAYYHTPFGQKRFPLTLYSR